MVFYRKHRPQTIEELDSREVRNRLSNVLSSASVPHAFLFTGPKGLGKTSTARIIAKSLNCEKRRGIEPCNKCQQCISITNGTNMDILEIDGASNRGIDEIRDLREKVKLSPMNATKKVYIIDEVHMLTTEAFNALLKTLEEPPAHVVFVLCTTEPHKVPATILSRCLHIQFKKATEEELIRSFERIVRKEKLEADKDALKIIAGFSDGGFRDGVKILEEMAFLAKDGKITKEMVEKHYSVAGTQYKIAQIIKSIEEKDLKASFEVITKLVNEGVEFGYFMEELIGILHNSLLSKVGLEIVGEGLVLDNLKLDIQDLKRLIELLSKAKGELKYAVLPQIPLELAIVEWSTSSFVETGPVKSNPSHQGSSLASPGTASRLALQGVHAVGSPSSFATRPMVISQEKQITNKSPKLTQQEMEKYNELDALRNALIDNVKAHNHSVAGVLRGCAIKSYDKKTLVLETNFKFHKDKLSELKTMDILNNACREVTKKDVKIEVELKPAFAKASAGEGR